MMVASLAVLSSATAKPIIGTGVLRPISSTSSGNQSETLPQRLD